MNTNVQQISNLQMRRPLVLIPTLEKNPKEISRHRVFGKDLLGIKINVENKMSIDSICDSKLCRNEKNLEKEATAIAPDCIPINTFKNISQASQKEIEILQKDSKKLVNHMDQLFSKQPSYVSEYASQIFENALQSEVS